MSRAGATNVWRRAKRDVDGLSSAAQSWLTLRESRTSDEDAQFHGSTGRVRGARGRSVRSRTYIGCPFKFYAQHILRLDEEPDDEEVMDPRRQGSSCTRSSSSSFASGRTPSHREITPANLDVARERFAAVVDAALSRVSEGEAPLEMHASARLSGCRRLGEAVLRMEAERPVSVVARLLEHQLDGAFTIQTRAGPREEAAARKGGSDRPARGRHLPVDRLQARWPPDRGKALRCRFTASAPSSDSTIQGALLDARRSRVSRLQRPQARRPLFSNDAGRAETLTRAQQRVADTLDAIASGEFPPAPDDVYRCETCSFAAVCRKDYVGDI